MSVAERLRTAHTMTLGVRGMDLLNVAAAVATKAKLFLTFELRQRAIAQAAELKVLPEQPKWFAPTASPFSAVDRGKPVGNRLSAILYPPSTAPFPTPAACPREYHEWPPCSKSRPDASVVARQPDAPNARCRA